MKQEQPKNASYCLFVTDIDGTIMGPRYSISRETKEAIELLESNGIGVTVATGRNYWEAKEIVTTLGISLPVILANGAQIYHFKEERLLHAETICNHTLNSFLQTLGVKGDVNARWYNGVQWMETSYEDFIISESRHIVQRFILKDPTNALDLVDSKCNPYWVFSDGHGHYELTPKSANKGRGLFFLCQHLGLDLKKVIALGNDCNDVELIKIAGIGLAVAGAHSDLLSVADGITVKMEEHPIVEIAGWMLGNLPRERIVMSK